MVTVTTAGHPTNGFYSKIHFGASGFNEGLTIGTEDCTSDCTGGNQKRWTWNNWTQDSVAGILLGYPMNPRTIENRVGDGTNTRKTAITYNVDATDDDGGYAARYGQVQKVEVGSTSTVLKTQTFTYVTDTNYISRRLVTLPSEIKLFEGTTSGPLMSKVTYVYDEDTDADLTGTTQHDTSNYGVAFNDRGNLTRTWRWDVRSGYEDNQSYAVSSQIAYNIAGSPVSQKDPLNRTTSISYADVFNSSGNPTTNAYPTTITDPGGNSSSIKYRYDIGANVWARSPTPYGDNNSAGKTTERTYLDSTGQIEKEEILNTGAYTRYQYADSGNAITTYSTITHEGSGSPGTSDKVATLTEFDGAGRVWRTRTDNPDSSSVYTAKMLQYDILGRVTGETVPTLVNGSWEPTGDDLRNGDWIWNLKDYDWKGRITRSIPSDSTGNDGKDTVFSYVGCGCAGGQETTISGPQADAIDMGGGTTVTTGKRKTEKLIEDILGRIVERQLRSLDGTNLYATTTIDYNGRDQETQIVEYEGSISSSNPHQTTTMSFDGHGRLSALHKPEWYGSSTNDPRYTTTTYNADDTIATVTDPRGAVMTYTYETESSTLQRPLVTGIAYAAPSPNPSPSPTYIPPTANVTLQYDDAGNRTQMDDGTGTLYYKYDELSRLKTERKVFADDLVKALAGGYTLTYEYHLNGSVKKITDPFGNVASYAADKAGRITDIGTGTGTLESTYIADIAYRSFGAVKSMTMSTSNQTSITMTYDDALRPIVYTADNSTTGSGWVQNASYTYHKDGALKTITDNAHTGFNQTNDYDFAGRLKKNDVGAGSTFTQSLGYDAFSNLTSRTSQTYSLTEIGFSTTYSNNRKSRGTYDAAGNIVESTSGQELPTSESWYADEKTWNYDAAGRMSRWEEHGPWGASTKRGGETTFDGDGRPAKQAELQSDFIAYEWSEWSYLNWYYIYSSVTGQKITDIIADGTYGGHRVYMGGTVIHDNTFQGPFVSSPDPYSAIGFKITDPVSGSTQEMYDTGAIPTATPASTNARNELAGLGTSIPSVNPTSPYEPNYRRSGYAGNVGSGCRIDGMEATPAMCNEALAGGWAEQCPNNDCNARAIWYKDENGKERSILTTHVMWRDDDLGPHTYLPLSLSGGEMTYDLQDKFLNELLDRDAANELNGSWADFANFFQQANDERKKNRAPRRRKAPRRTPPARRSGIEDVAVGHPRTSGLSTAGFLNNFCATVAGVAQHQRHLWRGTDGRFISGPAALRSGASVAGKGLFGASALISTAQVIRGDVSPGRYGLDIIMSGVGTFGGPKGAVIAGGYFLYQNLPPPAFPQGRRVISTNTCHPR